MDFSFLAHGMLGPSPTNEGRLLIVLLSIEVEGLYASTMPVFLNESLIYEHIFKWLNKIISHFRKSGVMGVWASHIRTFCSRSLLLVSGPSLLALSTLLYKAGKILRNVAPKFFPIYSRFSPRWESHFQNSALPSPKNVLAPFTSKFPPPDPLVHMPHLFGDRRITTKDTDFGLEVP